MAITGSAINYNGNALLTFLQGCVPDFFGSVTMEGNEIVCKDADGNTLYKCYPTTSESNWRHYAYADAANFISKTGGYLGVKQAYKTAKGIMLICNNDASVVLSHTNNGAFCALIPDEFPSENLPQTKPALVCAWGDELPLTQLVRSGAIDAATSNQIILEPIPTHSRFGEPSYFADAYFAKWSQFRVPGEFAAADGTHYFTDGWIVLRDE